MASLRPLLRAKHHHNLLLLNPAANNIIRLRALRHQPRRLLLRPNSTSTSTSTSHPQTSPEPHTTSTSTSTSPPNSEPPTPKSYTTADIRSLLLTPRPRPLLIDLREPSELASTGHIPTALSLPLVSNPDAFHLHPDDFFARFGWPRPRVGEEVVFYCMAGVRSRAAVGLAGGWVGEGVGVGDFGGGWRAWVGEGGVGVEVE